MELKIRRILLRAGFMESDDGYYSGSTRIYVFGGEVSIFNEDRPIFLENISAFVDGRDVLTSVLKSLGLWSLQ